MQLRDYIERGADENLGIPKIDKQPNLSQRNPQSSGAAPSLIDILHRLLWLAEHKPQNIPEFLTVSAPDATQLRLVAQALAGRALTPAAEQEGVVSQRTQEQQAIDTLLASWKRLVEDPSNIFTQSK